MGGPGFRSYRFVGTQSYVFVILDVRRGSADLETPLCRAGAAAAQRRRAAGLAHHRAHLLGARVSLFLMGGACTGHCPSPGTPRNMDDLCAPPVNPVSRAMHAPDEPAFVEIYRTHFAFVWRSVRALGVAQDA